MAGEDSAPGGLPAVLVTGRRELIRIDAPEVHLDTGVALG
jgi:hypothetical protein